MAFDSVEHLRALSEQKRPMTSDQGALPSDEDIDLSDMPELTAEEMSRAVRGWKPLSQHQVTLWLDDQVLGWLLGENERSISRINHTLRREMQYQERKTKAASGARAKRPTLVSKVG